MSDEQETSTDLTAVFTVYGHASFYATLFEMELVALIQTVMPGANMKRSDWEQTDAKLRELTMGALRKELKKHKDLGDEFESYLKSTIELRNFLTHHFYEARLFDLQSDISRKRALDELKVICIRLKEACDNVRTIYRQIAKNDFGFDSDFLKHA
jgi:hypothetical protein